MKIIATTTEKNFLVEATESELMTLVGLSNTNNARSQDFKHSRLRVNGEIDVSKFAKTASYVRRMDEQNLQRIKEFLTGAIDNIDEATDTVNKINLFDMLGDEDE